jgi:uncharacterized protein YjiK
MKDVNLFVEGTVGFRKDLFYIITNEERPGAIPFLGVEIDEPSGLCYRPGHKTLLVVGSEGDIAEVDFRGRTLRKGRISGDLEGIAIDPNGQYLYVCSEKKDMILEIDIEDFSVVHAYKITVAEEISPRPTMGEEGIEGLCFLPGENDFRLFAVNENDPPLLIELRLQGQGRQAEAVVINAVPVEGEDLSELIPANDAKTLLAFSDRENRLFELSPAGKIGRQWILPGREQEAITFLPDGSLVVCEQDGFLRIYSQSALRQYEVR